MFDCFSRNFLKLPEMNLHEMSCQNRQFYLPTTPGASLKTCQSHYRPNKCKAAEYVTLTREVLNSVN